MDWKNYRVFFVVIALLFMFDVSINCINLENSALAQVTPASGYCIDLCAEEFPEILDFLPEWLCQIECNRCEELEVSVCIEASDIPGISPHISCDCGGECCSSSEKCCRMESGNFCCNFLDECCEKGCAPWLTECCGEGYCLFPTSCCEGETSTSCCNFLEKCCDGKCCEVGEICCGDGKCCSFSGCCRGECCSESEMCTYEGCCPKEQACGGILGTCCKPDENCYEIGRSVKCCPSDIPACGNPLRCCPPDQCVDGVCECDSPCGYECCSPDEVCYGGQCVFCPEGRIVCNGECCREGTRSCDPLTGECSSGGCCPGETLCQDGYCCCLATAKCSESTGGSSCQYLDENDKRWPCRNDDWTCAN